jgi:hypothetical protein
LFDNDGCGSSGNFIAAAGTTEPSIARSSEERDRRFADSPLEEAVMSELVSEKPKFPVTREYTGNFLRSGLQA